MKDISVCGQIFILIVFTGYLQSSSAIDLMTKTFEYIRRAVKKVATVRQTASVATTVL